MDCITNSVTRARPVDAKEAIRRCAGWARVRGRVRVQVVVVERFPGRLRVSKAAAWWRPEPISRARRGAEHSAPSRTPRASAAPTQANELHSGSAHLEAEANSRWLALALHSTRRKLGRRCWNSNSEGARRGTHAKRPISRYPRLKIRRDVTYRAFRLGCARTHPWQASPYRRPSHVARCTSASPWQDAGPGTD